MFSIYLLALIIERRFKYSRPLLKPEYTIQEYERKIHTMTFEDDRTNREVIGILIMTAILLIFFAVFNINAEKTIIEITGGKLEFTGTNDNTQLVYILTDRWAMSILKSLYYLFLGLNSVNTFHLLYLSTVSYVAVSFMEMSIEAFRDLVPIFTWVIRLLIILNTWEKSGFLFTFIMLMSYLFFLKPMVLDLLVRPVLELLFLDLFDRMES